MTTIRCWGLLTVWETGVRVPVFQRPVGAGVRFAGVQAAVGGGGRAGDFEGPSMAAAGLAPSMGHFEAAPSQS